MRCKQEEFVKEHRAVPGLDGSLGTFKKRVRQIERVCC